MIYLIIGLIYSLIILALQSKQKNKEHWIGVLIVCVLFWPVHLISKLI